MKNIVLKFLLLIAGFGAAGSTMLVQESSAYTGAQADRGSAVYEKSCSICHGHDLVGGPGTPAVIGPEFMFGWKDKTAAELHVYLKTKMPPGNAGSLSDQQYADIIAFLLKSNGQAPNKTEVAANPAGAASIRISAP